MKEIIFLFVLFVANVIQAITGFAGTVLAMPPSIYLLGMDNAKVVLNVMALLSGLMIAVMSYHHMNKKEVIKICVCMVAVHGGSYLNKAKGRRNAAFSKHTS